MDNNFFYDDDGLLVEGVDRYGDFWIEKDGESVRLPLDVFELMADYVTKQKNIKE